MSADGLRSYVRDPAAKWWKFWKTILCPACGGDGFQKPPGWPDKKEIERLRPIPSPPAPPPIQRLREDQDPSTLGKRKPCIHDALEVIQRLSDDDKLKILNDLNFQLGIVRPIQNLDAEPKEIFAG